ncbi:hypothetical protein JHK85_021868 [Glycine max]|nr:hypothetical protein JHK85_021868 [Glycine max]
MRDGNTTVYSHHTETHIIMASVDPEIAKTREEQKRMEQQLASLTSVTFDTDLYGGSD